MCSILISLLVLLAICVKWVELVDWVGWVVAGLCCTDVGGARR